MYTARRWYTVVTSSFNNVYIVSFCTERCGFNTHATAPEFLANNAKVRCYLLEIDIVDESEFFSLSLCLESPKK